MINRILDKPPREINYPLEKIVSTLIITVGINHFAQIVPELGDYSENHIEGNGIEKPYGGENYV